MHCSKEFSRWFSRWVVVPIGKHPMILYNRAVFVGWKCMNNIRDIENVHPESKMSKAVKMSNRKKFENPFVQDKDVKHITNIREIYVTVKSQFKDHFYNEKINWATKEMCDINYRCRINESYSKAHQHQTSKVSEICSMKNVGKNLLAYILWVRLREIWKNEDQETTRLILLKNDERYSMRYKTKQLLGIHKFGGLRDQEGSNKFWTSNLFF